MKKILTAGTILLCMAVIATAAPRIAVDNGSYDFGTVIEGTFIRHTYVLSNEGDETLLITDARSVSTCPCTKMSLESDTLEPGESTKLSVVWDTGGYGGRSTGWVFLIDSNDPETPTLFLELSGVIEMAGPNHLPLLYLQYDLYALIDLRSPEAFAEEHILGAVNIPQESLEDYLGLLSYEHLIILYDAEGSGSSDAVELLLEGGYQAGYVVELHGGLSAWRKAGGATWSSEPLAEVESDASEAPTGRFGEHAITVQQLERWFFALIDVRTPEEYAEGHILGAINVPYESLEQFLEALPRDAQLVVYDEAGTVSDQAMQRMVEEGFPRAQSLIGGIGLWREVLGSTMLWPVQ